MSTDRKTILVIGDGVQYEAPAHEAITPGHLVELMSTGDVKKQLTEKVDAEAAFAIEDALQGNGIADAYAEDDRVFYRIFGKGEAALAVLEDGQNIAIGDFLESAGAGEVQKYTNGVKLFVALEALDASGTGTTGIASRRIAVRVL